MSDRLSQEQPEAGQSLSLSLRTRVEVFRKSGDWEEVTLGREFPARRTALIICDVWDRHWSRGASERIDAMAPRINEVVNTARRKGVLIIHAPSDTLDFYRDHPARRRMLEVPLVELPPSLELPDPPLPIDDSDG